MTERCVRLQLSLDVLRRTALALHEIADAFADRQPPLRRRGRATLAPPCRRGAVHHRHLVERVEEARRRLARGVLSRGAAARCGEEERRAPRQPHVGTRLQEIRHSSVAHAGRAVVEGDLETPDGDGGKRAGVEQRPVRRRVERSGRVSRRHRPHRDAEGRGTHDDDVSSGSARAEAAVVDGACRGEIELPDRQRQAERRAETDEMRVGLEPIAAGDLVRQPQSMLRQQRRTAVGEARRTEIIAPGADGI